MQTPEDVAGIEVRDPAKVSWLSQTTLSVDETMTIVDAIRERFPLLLDPPSDDICYATQNRQMAVKEISANADLVIVVGSGNSSNSVRLVEVALEAGAKASYRVDDASEIEESWLEGVDTVSVTSGASVPEDLVDGVLAFLAERGYPDAKAVHTAEESLIFALPPGAASRPAGRREGSLLRLVPGRARFCRAGRSPGLSAGRDVRTRGSRPLAQRHLPQREHHERERVADDQRARVVGEPRTGACRKPSARSASAPRGTAPARRTRRPSAAAGRRRSRRSPGAGPPARPRCKQHEHDVEERASRQSKVEQVEPERRRGAPGARPRWRPGAPGVGPLPRGSCGEARVCSPVHGRPRCRSSRRDAPNGRRAGRGRRRAPAAPGRGSATASSSSAAVSGRGVSTTASRRSRSSPPRRARRTGGPRPARGSPASPTARL